MMTHELEVSILAAPLAAMDRRALSQAWYSALHVAQSSSQQRTPLRSSLPSHCAIVPSRPLKAKSAAAKLSDSTNRQPVAARRQTSSEQRSATPLDSFNGTSVRSQLSRRIAVRFGAAGRPVARATFSIGRGTARVHVIMQSNGCTARLVAICRPNMREVVGRALAEARIALRVRGLTVEITTPPRSEECF